MKNKILVLHGPNLNLLGEREPEVYGTMTLAQVNQELRKVARELQVTLKIFQSNSEGKLIDLLHQHRRWADGVVINPGAFTHYSYAIRDAIASIQRPTVEVHLSDLHKRAEQEAFRGISVIAPVCVRQIMGLGWKSYAEGIHFLSSK